MLQCHTIIIHIFVRNKCLIVISSRSKHKLFTHNYNIYNDSVIIIIIIIIIISLKYIMQICNVINLSIKNVSAPHLQ